MKPLLLLIVLASALSSSGQEGRFQKRYYSVDIFHPLTSQPRINKIDSLPAVLKELNLSIQNQGFRLLPQDNMPCIMPPVDISAIPNAWTGKIGTPFIMDAPSMPNPALPQQGETIHKKNVPLKRQ